MTKGFVFDPTAGRLTIVNGSRTVATSDGTLVNLLTTQTSISAQALSFPDFSKDNAYVWTTTSKFVPLSSPFRWQHGESAATFITAVPQEYSAITELATVPPGADFFIGRVKLSRTSAPANQWMGRTLAVLPKSGEWLPMPGAFSALLEADIGMKRAMHIYIDHDPLSAHNGKLVMVAQQSVGPAIGGYTSSFGNPVSASPVLGDSAAGGSVTAGTTAGIPIFARASQVYGYTASNTNPACPSLYARGGSTPAAVNDTTNYASAYSIDLIGRFGRRS